VIGQLHGSSALRQGKEHPVPIG